MATKRSAKTKDSRAKSTTKKAASNPYQDALDVADSKDDADSELTFDSPIYREPVSASTDNGLPPDLSAEDENEGESKGKADRKLKPKNSRINRSKTAEESRSTGASVTFGADGDSVDEDQEVEALPRRRSTSHSAKNTHSAEARNPIRAGATLTQKAKEIVTRSSEELTDRYGHAFEDVKVASKKVQEEIKKQPYRIVMGAAGVVGLGLVLAKRYTQGRGKVPASSSGDSTVS